MNKNNSIVRLIALGPSFAEGKAVEEGKDTWGIQYTWRHFKLDRAFIMDNEEWIKAKNLRFDVPIDMAKEMRELKCPVYVSKKWPDVSNSVEYPIDKVLEYFNPTKYFMNSMSYMFALAIMEGYERIETYGIDLRYFNEFNRLIWRPSPELEWTEFMKKHPDWSFEEFMEKKHSWMDETHCLAFWAGVARGKGIEVVTTQKSSLMRPVMSSDTCLYGYETSPSIQRQRQEILDDRKKVEKKEKKEQVLGFRPKPGEDIEEFKKRVLCGAENPTIFGTATFIDEKPVEQNKELEG